MNTETMRAWQWTGTGHPLRLHDVPVSTPAADEVLVRVRAAGMCHSDVGELDEPSWRDRITRNPITLGHEIAGEVVAVGRDGGYASHHLAPASDLVAVAAVRPGGTVVTVGLGAEQTTVITADVVRRRVRIVGSSGGTRTDVEAAYRGLASGALRPTVERLSFAEVPAGIQRLRAGTVRGHLVVDPTDTGAAA